MTPGVLITNTDIFTSRRQTLVCPVNTIGVMGGGLALGFSQRMPWIVPEYMRMCRDREISVGMPAVVTGYHLRMDQSKVLLFPTKMDWRDPSDANYISTGLQYFVEHFAEWGILEIAFPLLGCGLGKLKRGVILPMMLTSLGNIGIPVDIHDGTITCGAGGLK